MLLKIITTLLYNKKSNLEMYCALKRHGVNVPINSPIVLGQKLVVLTKPQERLSK